MIGMQNDHCFNPTMWWVGQYVGGGGQSRGIREVKAREKNIIKQKEIIFLDYILYTP